MTGDCEVWTKKHLMRFQSETCFFKFSAFKFLRLGVDEAGRYIHIN